MTSELYCAYDIKGERCLGVHKYEDEFTVFRNYFNQELNVRIGYVSYDEDFEPRLIGIPVKRAQVDHLFVMSIFKSMARVIKEAEKKLEDLAQEHQRFEKWEEESCTTN